MAYGCLAVGFAEGKRQLACVGRNKRHSHPAMRPRKASRTGNNGHDVSLISIGEHSFHVQCAHTPRQVELQTPSTEQAVIEELHSLLVHRSDQLFGAIEQVVSNEGMSARQLAADSLTMCLTGSEVLFAVAISTAHVLTLPSRLACPQVLPRQEQPARASD